MSSATLTSPPTATEKLVVDTDVASFVSKWHPEFAAHYVAVMRGFELVASFMTTAEIKRKGRQMSSADAWIAATALVLSASLVTNNPKDYRHLDSLQLASVASA